VGFFLFIHYFFEISFNFPEGEEKKEPEGVESKNLETESLLQAEASAKLLNILGAVTDGPRFEASNGIYSQFVALCVLFGSYELDFFPSRQETSSMGDIDGIFHAFSFYANLILRSWILRLLKS
jgi:hypothetical protein